MPVDRGGCQDDDADSAGAYDGRTAVQPVAHRETGNAGRHDEPQHKPMKMLVFSEGDRSDRQHGDEHRHGETVHEAHRRQCNRDPIKVPREVHRQEIELPAGPGAKGAARIPHFVHVTQPAGIVTYVALVTIVLCHDALIR